MSIDSMIYRLVYVCHKKILVIFVFLLIISITCRSWHSIFMYAGAREWHHRPPCMHGVSQTMLSRKQHYQMQHGVNYAISETTLSNAKLSGASRGNETIEIDSDYVSISDYTNINYKGKVADQPNPLIILANLGKAARI